MSATFGTPVRINISATANLAFSMSGVTSGQPIIVFVTAGGGNSVPTLIADTFSTPYLWTLVQSSSTHGVLAMWIGTGGVGTSGIITVTEAGYYGGVAIPCLGASTASGLAAIDGSSLSTFTSGTTINSVSLTPGASGEGAVYAMNNAGTGNSAEPGSPWVNTDVSFSGTIFGSVSTYASPPSGSALTTSWTTSGSASGAVAGLIVKAPVVPPGALMITMA